MNPSFPNGSTRRFAQGARALATVTLAAAASSSSAIVSSGSTDAQALSLSVPAIATAAPPSGDADHSRIASSYGHLPIRFEPNVGQAPAAVKFLARDAGYSIALTPDQLVLALPQPGAAPQTHGAKPAPRQQAVIGLNLVHANPKASLVAENRERSVSNYFVGNSPAKWHHNVANYAAVRYRNAYPGIDWVVYGNPRQLEYDLVVAPHADVQQIRLGWQGTDRLTLDDAGNLLVDSHGATLRQFKPVIYQTDVNGAREAVEGHYVIHGQQVAFAVGNYDRSRELVIDPALSYSTYLGGSNGDSALAIAVDGEGSAYVAGQTSSTDFPLAMPHQASNNAAAAGSTNAFIAKFSPDGSTLEYSTYLGGSTDQGTANGGAFGGDEAYGIAVDAAGNAYVAGFTSSTDFPLSHAFQFKNKSYYGTAFVTELSADGSQLVFSTYLGGWVWDQACAIAVSAAGEAYVTGFTYSNNFPVANALQPQNNAGQYGANNAFVTAFNAGGRSLRYSTYLGGSSYYGDSAYGIAVDSAGNAYVTGATTSTDFPTVNPYQDSNKANVDYGSSNAFVSQINPSGSALLYSTYLGGSGSDQANAIAVDGEGNFYVAGGTSSPDFPTINAFEPTAIAALPGKTAAFVARFDADGGALDYSTFLGGTDSGQASAIAVSSSGKAYVAGHTDATDFPTVNALQATHKAGPNVANGFVVQFSTDGSALTYSTYLGGSGVLGDFANAIAVDGQGNAYVAGETTSPDFPTAAPFQSSLQASASHSNAFVAKILNSPGAPIKVTATAGSGSVSLSWSAVAGATSYNLYQATTAGGEASNPTQSGITGTTATVSGLAEGTRYYFQVTAVDSIGESSRSTEVSATVSSSGSGGAMGLDVIAALAALSAIRRRRHVS